MCDRLPRKFDVQTSYKPSNYVLGLLLFVVNIKFPCPTYHTTEELYCLNSLGVHVCWGSETVTLYQISFRCILQPHSRLDSKHPYHLLADHTMALNF